MEDLFFFDVVSLDCSEMLDYLMTSKHYCTFELPEYFCFDEMLKSVREVIGVKPFMDCCSGNPNDFDDVSLDLVLSKDGKYGVRPLNLVNPYLYYFLCREICVEKHWSAIKECFEHFAVPNFVASALPIVSDRKESFPKSNIILNWWNSMEQRAIELSLEYKYMFITDITNCYGCIEPRAIERALSCKDTKYQTDTNSELAKSINFYLQAMQQGHNVGIPQGNVASDFIAELVLGYADLLLYEAIEKAKSENILSKDVDYKVLRYRDDYRILCNNHGDLEEISYLLQQVLARLNFKMNTSKTRMSNDIIIDSVKPDKLAYVYNTPIVNKKGCDFDGLQKHLYYILMFARKYPNCGQLKRMLSDFDKRVIKLFEEPKYTPLNLDSDNIFEYVNRDAIRENKNALIAVATQIAIENVTAAHYALRIVSRILTDVDGRFEREEVIDQIFKRMRNLPNSSYIQVWLQNMTYITDLRFQRNHYDFLLCKAVMNKDIQLWNNDWLNDDITEQTNLDIVDRSTLKDAAPIITFKETREYYDL